MNNNREILFSWIDEQLDTVDETDGACTSLILLINPAGDAREVFSLKAGAQRWTTATEMTDLFWAQATRTAKGIIGFVQFQMEAAFANTNGKTTRFLPFGVMGSTQLGPSAGGSAFGGLTTEGPTPIGVQSQGMRHQEQLAVGFFSGLQHVVNVLQKHNEKLMEENEALRKRNDEQWLALKNALLEIQNAAATKELRLLYAEVSRKVLTLLPGLANALSGREIFPAHVVEASMADTIIANFSPEEQQGLISMIAAHPNGQPLVGVLTDQLTRAKRRRETEQSELARASNGLPGRSYADGERDAAGEVMRVLRNEPPKLPVTNGTTQKVAEVKPTEDKPVAKPDAQDAQPAAVKDDTRLIEDLFVGVDPSQLSIMIGALNAQTPGLGDRMRDRFEQYRKEKGV
jgi:hypothetical protein